MQHSLFLYFSLLLCLLLSDNVLLFISSSRSLFPLSLPIYLSSLSVSLPLSFCLLSSPLSLLSLSSLCFSLLSPYVSSFPLSLFSLSLLSLLLSPLFLSLTVDLPLFSFSSLDSGFINNGLYV